MVGKINKDVYDVFTTEYYKVSNIISPYIQKLSKNTIIPDHITYFRLGIFILSMLSFYNSYSLTCSCLYMFYSFLDCLDGEYARVTNQITLDGDKLDRRVDLGCNIFISVLLFQKINFIIFCGLLYIMYFSTIHILSEEYYLEKFGNKKFQSKYLEGYREYIPFKTEHELIKYMKDISILGFGIYHAIIGSFLYILA
jgi:phosphatidylglycerophosphate synthase